MAENKKSIIIYYDILEQLKDFSDENFGAIMRAVIEYDVSGLLPTFNGELKVAFNCIKPLIDINRQKFIEKCDKNRQNIKNYWDKKDTNVNERKRMNTLATDKDTDKEKDKDKDTDKEFLEKQRTWFGRCFKIYPRKDNRIPALDIFCRKVKTGEYAKKVYNQIREYVIAEEDTETAYIKFFDNWLIANVEDEV